MLRPPLEWRCCAGVPAMLRREENTIFELGGNIPFEIAASFVYLTPAINDVAHCLPKRNDSSSAGDAMLNFLVAAEVVLPSPQRIPGLLYMRMHLLSTMI